MKIQIINKYLFNKVYYKILFILFVIYSVPARSEDNSKINKPIKSRMYLTYDKLTDGTKVLTAKLFTKDGKIFTPIVNAPVCFSVENDTSTLELGIISTDKEGLALLYLSKHYQLPGNLGRAYIFHAEYSGNDEYIPVDGQVEIKDLLLDFKLAEKDSEKTIEITVNEYSSEDTLVPAYDVEIYGYVKRLYSLLEIGVEYSDDLGMTSIEFPGDLPGDSIGNLTVIIKVEDSDIYGNVEKIKDINWGIPVSYKETKTPRALWADEAPLWMIIAVIVILAGAWFNFFLAIFKLYKVRKLGKIRK
ncbi:MAG: hypothetical protein JSV22_06660 [Bacteroidales bacterium]|nr:MAG: hypothetical protein JSV22_06660 [Bacteroidales bacterium]